MIASSFKKWPEMQIESETEVNRKEPFIMVNEKSRVKKSSWAQTTK